MSQGVPAKDIHVYTSAFLQSMYSPVNNVLHNISQIPPIHGVEGTITCSETAGAPGLRLATVTAVEA